MATRVERARLNTRIDDLAGQPHEEIARMLTAELGYKVTRNTVRYYLGMTKNDKNLPKGRPKGGERQPDIWDQLVPELLALTGLKASRLYRELSALLHPEGLPFRESAFHERTGSVKRAKTAASKRMHPTLLTRCRLRIRAVEVATIGTQSKRAYLFGYEELTGYISFDVIGDLSSVAGQIPEFVKDVESYLSLPILRICIIEASETPFAITLPKVQIDFERWTLKSVPLVSPLKKRDEIDQLERITKRQNDETARKNVIEVKREIADFVRSAKGDGTWRRLLARDIKRRELAQALKPFLGARFKLRKPSRRPHQ